MDSSTFASWRAGLGARPAVLGFYSCWARPVPALAEMQAELAARGVQVQQLDVESCGSLPTILGLGAGSVPCVLVIDAQRIRFRTQEIADVGRLRALLEPALF